MAVPHSATTVSTVSGAWSWELAGSWLVVSTQHCLVQCTMYTKYRSQSKLEAFELFLELCMVSLRGVKSLVLEL